MVEPRPRVTCLGVGSATDPQQSNTSLLYEGALRILFDCGYSVPHEVWRRSTSPDYLDAVYISHVHADHVFGLPPLLSAMKRGRERPLTLLGSALALDKVAEVIELGYPGSFGGTKSFEIRYQAISPDGETEWGGLRWSIAMSAHKVPNASVRVQEEGWAFAYSGDGSPTEATRNLFEGVDLLFHECATDLPGKPGHAAASELLPMAEKRGVKRLVLVHILPEMRPKVMARVNRFQGAMTAEIAQAGDSFGG